ncbi:MAG: DnaJ domain-containing protein [Geminicoccaceae bacterium]|nr:DnaJ domain-containing protein [Geminicoccaceae bacterium]
MTAADDPHGYYATLGVRRNATPDDVRQAFRRQAMVLHPDRSSRPDDADRFNRLREAYEVLRDPRKRLRYDAEALQAPSGAGGGRIVRLLLGGLVSPRLLWPVLSAVLAVTVILSLASLWAARRQVEERGQLLAEAHERLDAAVRDQADVRARYRSANFINLENALGGFGKQGREGGYVFHAEIAFPPERTDLDDRLRGQLNRSVVELAKVIGTIPAGRDWVIVIEGQAGEAAANGGVAVTAWETALVRLGSVVDYLVAHDMPIDRLAVRFQAGFGNGDAKGAAGTVEMKLLCCFY